MASTLVARRDKGSDLPQPAPTVEIVVPVYNEEHVLQANVCRLRAYLDGRFPFSALVTIADNASTDSTWEVASRLAATLPGVRAIHLSEKGRGRALRAAWSASSSEVVAYMDVDLATDLDGLLPLVAPLISGHSDLAIGSRLARGARVQRGTKREIISRCYNMLIRTTLRSGFTDAQCGFKAVRAPAMRRLLPLVADEGWFFDTELLILAEANGMRIHEVPVDWVDDPDSRVRVVSTAAGDLCGLVRVALGLARGRGRTGASSAAASYQASHFGEIGGLSTVVYLCLVLALHPLFGLFAANGLALALAAVANTVAHARITLPCAPFPRRSARLRLLRESAITLACGLLLSTLFLFATTRVTGSVTALGAALLAANAIVSAGRFVSYRSRMLRRTSASQGR